MTTLAASHPPVERGGLQSVSRAGVVLLLVLAVANGAFLYLVPGRAADEYAWSINPPICAAFLGAGYLAGTVATALVVFRTRWWRSLRVLPPALAVLSITLLAATLIHADRFRWDYAPTWIWFAVYAGVPFALAYLWWEQERAALPEPPAHPGLFGVRTASAVLGGLAVAVGALLFVLPAAGAEVWPWPLTPLLARATGAWYLMVGTALLACAVTLRRPHEAVIPYATLLAWSGLLLGLVVLHGDDLVHTGAPLVAWVLGQVALVGLSGWALARALPGMRASGETL
jgi:hypothetical protein